MSKAKGRRWALIAFVVFILFILLILFNRSGQALMNEVEIRTFITEQYGGAIQSIEEKTMEGQPVFEVELLETEGLYLIVVDRISGEVWSLTHVLEREQVAEVEEIPVETITEDDVKERLKTALREDIFDLDLQLGETDSRLIYYITVNQSSGYSEVEMDARTGEILMVTLKDSEDEQTGKQQQTPEVIGEKEAIRIALTHVDGKVDDIELDEENGRLVYEVEIELHDSDADVYIDAFTGELLNIKWED